MTDATEGTESCRGKIVLDCGQHDCPEAWAGDDLASIAKSVAWHYNKEHNDDLSRGKYEQIDTVERGGHHVHGNDYNVTRIPIYLTSFDAMKRIGAIDGYAVPSDNDRVCGECLHKIPDADDRIEDEPDDILDDSWTCRACVEEAEIDRHKEQNQSLTEFTA